MAFLNNADTPIFVQNQILRADDLNAMVKYFEEQSRLTRIFTIGIGIVNGLKLKLNYGEEQVLQSISISSGIAISSDGVLFELDQECFFGFYKLTTISRRAFQCINGQQGSCSDENEPEFVYELLGSQVDEQTVAIADLPNVEEDLKNFCVVLVRCEETVSRKSCFNDCEQSGADLLSQTRVMFVPDGILKSTNNGDTPTDTIGQVSIASPPEIERLGYDEAHFLDLCSIKYWTDLYLDYRTRCVKAYIDISNAYDSTYLGFYYLTTATSEENPFAHLQTALSELLNAYPNNVAPNISDIQYGYAFLRDLTLAYKEFFKAACGLSIGINPDTQNGDSEIRCSFPGYVALGRLELAEPGAENDRPKPCRTSFFPAAASEGKDIRLEQAKMLYERLKDLVKPDRSNSKNLDLPLNTGLLLRQDIRITGSCTQKFGLSRQAVGFYLKLDNVIDNWNAENPDCENMTQFVNHYTRSGIPDNVLLRNIDEFDFYRIEGHIGEELPKAEEEIKRNQKKLNLPFDIRPLLIEPDIRLEAVLQEKLELYGGEMQEIYQNTRADILCKIDEFVAEGGVLSTSFDLFYADLKAYRELGMVPQDDIFTTHLQDAINDAATISPILLDSLQNAQPIFISLLNKYGQAIEEIKKAMTFSGFAELHPGMEHLGGVPSGGTFIPVYTFQFTSAVSKQDVAAFFNVDSKQTDERMLQLILAQELTEEDLGRLRRNLKKVVVADFCLPYACCSNSPVIRYQFESPNLQIFVENNFCFDPEDEPDPIAYTVSPEGGTLSIFINEATSEAKLVNNASTDQTLDIAALIDATTDLGDNGQARIKIRYQLGSQQVEEVVNVFKKPDASQLECEQGDPIIDENGKWVGFNYIFTHGLIGNEITSANWKIGNLHEKELDTDSSTEIFPIRTDQEGFNLPIVVMLNVENGPCKDSETKTIEQQDFCKEATLELLGGCALASQGVENKLVLKGIKCASASIPPNAAGNYQLSRDGEQAFVRLVLDCPGGTFSVVQDGEPLADVSENFPGNLLVQIPVPVDEENTELAYLFVFDVNLLSDDDAVLLGLAALELQFDITEAVTFNLAYSPPTPCSDNKLEFSITISIEGEPDPEQGPEDDDEREEDVETPEERPGNEDELDEAEIIVASPTPTSASKKLSKAASTLLNTRSSHLREQLTALEVDKPLTRTKVFGLSKSFLILPANDLVMVNTRFEELSKALNTSLSRAKGPRKTELNKLAAIALQDLLDKQVALSPEALPAETMTTLKTILPKWKKHGLKIATVKKAWNATTLKKVFPVAAIDQIQKILK